MVARRAQVRLQLDPRGEPGDLRGRGRRHQAHPADEQPRDRRTPVLGPRWPDDRVRHRSVGRTGTGRRPARRNRPRAAHFASRGLDDYPAFARRRKRLAFVSSAATDSSKFTSRPPTVRRRSTCLATRCATRSRPGPQTAAGSRSSPTEMAAPTSTHRRSRRIGGRAGRPLTDRDATCLRRWAVADSRQGRDPGTAWCRHPGVMRRRGRRSTPAPRPWKAGSPPPPTGRDTSHDACSNWSIRRTTSFIRSRSPNPTSAVIHPS